MINLENAAIRACISEHGAELKKLESKTTDRNYIYDGSAGWKRSAPVLFPNIGGLAEEKFIYGNISLPALPHGFARDMEFEITEMTDEKAVLVLENSGMTAAYFPFAFILKITYSLVESGIEVRWDVENRDLDKMYFSIGAHPGFSLVEGSSLEDYELIFDKKTSVYTRRVEGRYLTEHKEHISDPCTGFPLSAELMADDAIILEDTGISRMDLCSKRYNYHLAVDFPDFPVVAIWTDTHQVDNARFVCIEPWCGINSLVEDKAEDISKKSRINVLDAGRIFTRNYAIKVIE